MKKLIVISLALLLIPAPVAEAKTFHIVKTHNTAGLTSVGRYGYTYHRLATIKCPYSGCRTKFQHK